MRICDGIDVTLDDDMESAGLMIGGLTAGVGHAVELLVLNGLGSVLKSSGFADGRFMTEETEDMEA